MDNRFTKRRMGNMLSYDWGKMLLMVLGIILVWSLAFTVGAPRASTGQVFGAFVYGRFVNKKNAGELLAEAKEGGAFSYDVLDFTARDMDEKTYGMLMQAMTAVQEGDIMIVSDSDAEQFDLDKPEKERGNGSAFKGLIDGYGLEIYDLDRLINDAENYCLNTVKGVKKDGDIYRADEERIKAYFAGRMYKDPRFRKKNSERYLKGEKDEIERIKSVWNNAERLKYCLESHPLLRRNYRMFEQRNLMAKTKDPSGFDPSEFPEEEQEEKTYGLNLGALNGGARDISAVYAFEYTSSDEKTITSEGAILCVFDYKSKQPDLQYEALGFINYVITNYSNFLENEKEDIDALID